MLDEKCYLSILVNKLTDDNNLSEFISEDIRYLKIILIIMLFISIFSFAYPEFNLFNQMLILNNKLKKFNK